MDDPQFLDGVTGPVAVLSQNRPTAGNAQDEQMLEELQRIGTRQER